MNLSNLTQRLITYHAATYTPAQHEPHTPKTMGLFRLAIVTLIYQGTPTELRAASESLITATNHDPIDTMGPCLAGELVQLANLRETKGEIHG
jgi:hypothetical protein